MNDEQMCELVKFTKIAESQYRVEKSKGGFWPYCVLCGDGTRILYSGHKKTCEKVARELTMAFHNGGFVERNIKDFK